MRLWVVVCVGAVLAGAITPAAGGTSAAPASYLNVVAHQDDDVLFLNPDLRNSIAARRPNTTVFLTAGEAFQRDGAGRPDDPPLASCRDDQDVDREDYARCRQLGARAANARMAGVADSWTQVKIRLDTPEGPYWAEEHALTARPDIRLVFLNLPEWADTTDDASRPCAGTPELRGASLNRLWDGERGTCSMVPSGTVLWADDVRNPVRDKDHLVHLLQALYQRYRPTVVRTQDPDPDPRHQNPDWLHDHNDHVIGARFAAEAARGHGRVLRVVPYRNYNIQESPVNLDARTRAEKAGDFAAYDLWDAWSDPVDHYTNWPQRMIHRDTTGTHWVGRNQDGRLQAFSVQGERLATWWQTPSGWSSTTVATPGPLAAGLAVTETGDGRIQVVGRRVDTHEIVTTAQRAPNAAFGAWVSLGSPNPGSAQVGTPVAARGADGLVRVFVKNAGGGLSHQTQRPGGRFPAVWQDAFGTGLQDGLAVGVGPSGGPEVFGFAVSDRTGRLLHWSGTPLTLRPDPAGPQPSGPPSVARTRDGRLDVFYRLAGERGGAVGRTWQLADGSWTAVRDDLGGPGGVGAPAVVDAPTVADARVLVFTTNRGGGVSTTRQAADGGYATPWTDLGGFLVGQPAAATDRTGRVVVFTLDDNGGLTVRRQHAAGGRSGFENRVTLPAP
ncbi:PIG-L family deacetylase [Actinosynnema sp. NPDC023587]|uniref:PIG-L family deacetylase n=1 Tax=Actinosynnema sp. NPDC023587 TaxID=3154695 RepID=UPI0033EF8EA7